MFTLKNQDRLNVMQLELSLSYGLYQNMGPGEVELNMGPIPVTPLTKGFIIWKDWAWNLFLNNFNGFLKNDMGHIRNARTQKCFILRNAL